jgi:hypothetical protein
MNCIYGAINLYGATTKKYAFGGRMKPGLTCPFPEMDDFDNILHDAWGLVHGDPIARERFQNALDAISLSVRSRGGVRTEIDLLKKRSKASKSKAAKEHRHTDFPPEQTMIPREKMVLLMVAARHLGGKNKVRANRYMNLVLSQLMEYHWMFPVYQTCRRAMLGDRAAQKDVRRLIGIWGEDCRGRDSWPAGFDPHGDWDPTDEPMDPRLEDALKCMEELASGSRADIHDYEIDSLTPYNGCSGDLAVITGRGFGLLAGQVRFVGATVDSAVFADAIVWTDTSIELTIPPGATYGPIDLLFPFRRGKIVCGMLASEQHRNVSNERTYFVGGRPRIDSISFRKNGVVFDSAVETVLPGDSVSLVYDSTPNAPRREIDVREAQIDFANGQFQPSQLIDEQNTLFQGFGGPSHSVYALPATNYTRSTRITCAIDLTNHCGTTSGQAYFVVHRPATISLTGMEVTQAIQFFRAADHIALESEQKPDNSVPLISEKPTLVRVYYTTDQDETFNQGKSFGLSVDLRGVKDDQALGSALTPLNINTLFATRDNSVLTQRGRLTSSANFLLPGTWITPSQVAGPGFPIFPLRLTAQLGVRQFEPWIRDRIDPDADQLTVDGLIFNRSKDLSCVIVRIEYTGPGSGNGAGDPPSLDECIQTLVPIRNINPTAELELFLPPHEDDWVVTFDGDLTAASTDGSCGDEWGSLLDLLEDKARFAWGDDDAFWTGLLNPAINFQGVAGCGHVASGAMGVAAFKAGDSETGTHEIAHSYTLPHADENVEFPDYSLTGSFGIGEFGVDVARISPSDLSNLDNLVFGPSTTDFMFSVASFPVWTAPYTYQKSMEFVFARSAVPSGVENSFAMIRRSPRGERICVSGRLDRKKGTCRLNPLYHLPNLPSSPVRARGSSDYEIVMLDSDEGVVFRCALYQREGSTSFSHRIPFAAAGRHVEIRQKDVPLCRVTRRPQEIQLVGLELQASSERYSLTWDVKPAQDKYWCGVQLSCNDGESWSTLKLLEDARSYSFDPRKIGGGTKCRLRVFVTDGFNTVWKETAPFSLRMKAPRLAAVNFRDGMKLVAGADYDLEVLPIYVMGVPHRGQVTWYVDDKLIGNGRRMGLAFAAGKHVIKVVAENFEESALVVTVAANEKPGGMKVT